MVSPPDTPAEREKESDNEDERDKGGDGDGGRENGGDWGSFAMPPRSPVSLPRTPSVRDQRLQSRGYSRGQGEDDEEHELSSNADEDDNVFAGHPVEPFSKEERHHDAATHRYQQVERKPCDILVREEDLSLPLLKPAPPDRKAHRSHPPAFKNPRRNNITASSSLLPSSHLRKSSSLNPQQQHRMDRRSDPTQLTIASSSSSRGAHAVVLPGIASPMEKNEAGGYYHAIIRYPRP
eukprot:1540839-Rhodomonas_salina.1